MRRPRGLIAVPLVALVVAGCGDDEGSNRKGGPTAVKVGVIPIVDVAPLYLGRRKGFFREENLTIEPRLAEGGAAIVPSVVSGDFQVGFSNTTSLIIAASKGLPVQIIAHGVSGGAAPTDREAYDAVLVRRGGAIASLTDLEGKTVAVNTLNNVGPLTINAALERAGVDYRRVKYVEVPFPEMNAALQAGRVDAAWVVEPFVTQGLRDGARALLHSFEQAIPNMTISTYFASRRYIDGHRDVVDRFARAMNRSLEYAQGHPNEVRDVISTYTKIPRAVARSMVLPRWGRDLGRPTIERTAALARRYGFVAREPNLDELIR